MKFQNNINTQQKMTAKYLAVFAVVVFLIFPNLAEAKTFEQYKNNVNRVKKEFASLLLPEEDISTEEIEENRNEIFDNAKNLLPAAESIEFEGSTFEVNNTWIAEKIEEYKNDEKTAEDKQLILTAIYERLDAIELKLEELETSVKSENSKDAEKQKLTEILNREEFEKPKPEEESFLEKIWRWFDEWMKNNVRPNRNTPLPPSNFGSFARVLQILLYAVVIGLIGFLIYKFAPFFIKKFREREKSKKKKERVILGEKISANETSENLFSEAEKLAGEGNLRGAIRKGYIALLFELSERKLIGLAKHKTNRDYLRSVRKKQDLYNSMNGLTLNYERHWYGFQDADEAAWEEFRREYRKTLNKN